MGQTISIYDQVAQPRMLLLEDRSPKLLQSRYFPTNDPYDLCDSKAVLLDFDNGDFESAMFITRGYSNENTTTYWANSVIPPRVAAEDVIDCAGKDRVLFESLCRNDLSPSHADALDALLRIKAARLVNRCSRSIERLCVMALSSNAIQFTCDTSPTDSTQVTIDCAFYDGSNSAPNPQKFVPASTSKNWGQSGATPYDDVCSMIQMLVDHGGRAEDLLMSPVMWGYLYADMNSKGLLNSQIHYTNIANGDIRGLFSEEIEGAKCVGQAMFNGFVLNLLVYVDSYKAANGTMTRYLPDDFACILAPDCGRTICAASALPNPVAMINGSEVAIKLIAGKYLVSRVFDFASESVVVRCASNPLPSPRRSWGWVCYSSAV